MGRWDEIKGWARHPYCLYLHAFQDGLSAFYNGALREADARFKSALEFAIDADYPRGQIQAHFHLGLVAFDRIDYTMASECFAAAQKIAVARSATRFLERIAVQKARIESCSQSLPPLETLKRKIEFLIINGHFTEAQQTLAEADIIRRQERLHPQRESLYFYQPLILWGLGKPKQAERAFRKITDPILRAHVLVLKERTLGLSLVETAELFSLKRTHGLREDIYRSPLSVDHSEVCGVTVGEIQNANIRSLIQLFLTETGPLTKERIAEAIWTREYNPLIDDKKVYQLIYNARSFFRKPDLFKNRYGFYELNLK
jgi:tetratricopeptide (TPR) repeat protein